MKQFITAVIASIFLSLALLAEPPVNPDALPDPVQEAAARALMKDIRCLVCQNQSIEDSDADLAKDLRQIVREQTAEGKSPAEIKAWLVSRYGDWVLLEPPFDERTYFLWGSPFILLGFLGIWFMFRERDAKSVIAPLNEDERLELDALLQQDDLAEGGDAP